MGVGVASLKAAEMLPVSLLTPMTADLGITEGMAGQAVTATAIIALVTSLFVTVTVRRLDDARCCWCFPSGRSPRT